MNLERFRENLEYVCHTHPHVITDLFTMHGFPTETEDEAMMTIDFIKSIKWLHFPYIFILKIFPNTDMEKLALKNGITRERLQRFQENTAYHELNEALVHDKSFTAKYQSSFFYEYFLSKDRLSNILPEQMKLLTEDEILQKYNSYLPTGNSGLSSFAKLLEFIGIEE
ncbi:MAG: hypothetical protein GY870_17870, partial [archaeon]|nr:hypothetical protein [archaeon]